MTGVAIVIPMLNEAAGLPRLLRSLAALEPPPAEVLGGEDCCSLSKRKGPPHLSGLKTTVDGFKKSMLAKIKARKVLDNIEGSFR
jgi:hypothetical protein